MNLDRRKQIAEIINTEGTVKSEELVKRLGVSIETIRRDLTYLEKQGMIKKVYGGAASNKFMTAEPNYLNRESLNYDEKLAIATEAEKLINSQDAVFFDIGTNVLLLAKQLDEGKNIHAFTNSIRTAIALSEKGCEVIIPGGTLRSKELSLSGSFTIDNMDKFVFNKVFIGVGGITTDGVTDFVSEEAFVRNYLVKNANQVIALADFSKFGVQTMCKVCDIEDIDVLICDSKAPKKMLSDIEKMGVKVIIAD